MRRLVTAVVLSATLLAPAIAPADRASLADANSSEQKAQALRIGLATRKLREVRFEGSSLDGVLAWLRVATGWNYVVKRDVIAKAGLDLETVRATLTLDDVTVATLLELVLEPHGLVATVRGNIVFVTTKADAMGKPVLVLHPISQLTWRKIDFHGPEIDLYPSDYTPPENVSEVVVEDDPFADPQHVVDLVKQMVDAPWDSEGWSITATKQCLAVKAPKSVQRLVSRAVASMSALK
jgi:hypothetical protein